jgi:transcription elongation factor GreA
VRDVEDDSTEVYTLAFGEHVDVEKAEISMASPIGKALLGRREGEEVSVTLPIGTVRYEIIEVFTIHQVMETDDG